MKKTLIVILSACLLVGGFLGYIFWQRSQLHFGYVSGPIQNTTSTPYSDLIKVDNPKPNQVIQSPFTVTGQARGNWFFEASFPIKLVDLSGNVIVQTFASAKGEWMTENFVPFESTLNFVIATTTQPAILILRNDNPSGLPANDKEIRIPVILQKDLNIQQRTIKLYYYNSNLDKDSTGNALCSRQGLVVVDRQIPITKTPIQDAINLLLKGQLTSQEKTQGITTEYPLSGFTLQAASLNNGNLTLTFKDLNNQTVGGSCRVGILWFQIEATAKQFPEVSEVHFMPEELFQP